MKYFLDTEFHEDFYKPILGKRRHFIDLISIGIVSEDNRSYYAVSKDFDLKKVWKDNWLRENVLRQIHKDLCEKEGTYSRTHHYHLFEAFTLESLKTLIRWHGKTNEQIANEIREFTGCQEYNGVWATVEKPEFYGYYADYDWVLLCSLFGRMIDLPSGFPMYCIDLQQMLDRKAEGYSSHALSKMLYPLAGHNVFSSMERMGGFNKTEALKKHPLYPAEVNSHHALDDAGWCRDLYQFVTATL